MYRNRFYLTLDEYHYLLKNTNLAVKVDNETRYYTMYKDAVVGGIRVNYREYIERHYNPGNRFYDDFPINRIRVKVPAGRNQCI